MARNCRARSAPFPVTIRHDDKDYSGSYYLADGCVTVRHGVTEKSTQLGGHRHYVEQLAQLLLSEMVRGLP